MTLKEILLQELETADDSVIAEIIDWVRSRKALTENAKASHKFTLAEAIAQFREQTIAEGIEIDPEEIWGDVRDRTPVSDQPRW